MTATYTVLNADPDCRWGAYNSDPMRQDEAQALAQRLHEECGVVLIVVQVDPHHTDGTPGHDAPHAR